MDRTHLDTASVQLTASLDQRVEIAKAAYEQLDHRDRHDLCECALRPRPGDGVASLLSHCMAIGLLMVITSTHNQHNAERADA